jgi:hypothetical protein
VRAHLELSQSAQVRAALELERLILQSKCTIFEIIANPLVNHNSVSYLAGVASGPDYVFPFSSSLIFAIILSHRDTATASCLRHPHVQVPS